VTFSGFSEWSITPFNQNYGAAAQFCFCWEADGEVRVRAIPIKSATAVSDGKQLVRRMRVKFVFRHNIFAQIYNNNLLYATIQFMYFLPRIF
jgi:hypothetical protein